MKKILLILISLFCICGCNKNDVKELDPYELMKSHEYVVIDVRTEEEYNEGHVIDSINIPYDEIDENINISKDSLVFVYCQSGKRSAIAYEKLKELGYDVYDLGAYNSVKLDKE